MLKIVKNSWRFAKIANKENRCQTAGDKCPEKRKILRKEIWEIDNAKKVSLESVCKIARTYSCINSFKRASLSGGNIFVSDLQILD